MKVKEERKGPDGKKKKRFFGQDGRPLYTSK
jgi:hypothetical protein